MGRFQIVAYPYLSVPFFVPKLGKSLRRRKTMPYELLYTRSISSDDRIRFTDVPITSPSIMVDVLSLRSPYYRIAGYAYSIVSDGLIDYERGEGYTLPFGKNRLLFPSVVLPYYLEFFPKWGTRQAIISVYTGQPSPPGPQPVWKTHINSGKQFSLSIPAPGIDSRIGPNAPNDVSPAPNAISGAIVGDYLIWKNQDGSMFSSEINVWFPLYTLSQSEYDGYTNQPGSIPL